MDGNTLDFHRSEVECVFPNDGPAVYIQKNKFIWDDGRVYNNEFSGILKEDRIFWNTNTFKGYGWAAGPSIFLLELDRKDVPGASFTECIIMAPSKKDRVRTWHWFQDGQCFKRTLCNETLISNPL